MFVDSHCHLNFDQFKDDFEQLIARAKDNNVNILQTICTKISEFHTILEIVNKYDFIYGSVGVHPNEVDNEELCTAQKLLELANHNKIIGIGETGLDYFYKKSDIKKQQTSFIEHIIAARELDLPVIIHTRDAEDDTKKILLQQMKEGKFKPLIHCFTASEEFADFCLELEIPISISGIVTFKNATNLQQIVKKYPLNKLLIETDAPYLAPVPFRGKRNEPSYVTKVAEFIASLKEISANEVALQTTQNFINLFDKVKLS